MQVYVVVHDGNGNMLIAKKRTVNRYWGQRLGEAKVVNQAGQWALPGGSKHPQEAAETAARREFLEETGVLLDGATQAVIQNADYEVWSFAVSEARLTALHALININLRPSDGNPDEPISRDIVDWELEEVRIVPVGERRPQTGVGFLGVQQSISPPHQAAVGQARSSTQAIDWYADIAERLPDLVGETGQ